LEYDEEGKMLRMSAGMVQAITQVEGFFKRWNVTPRRVGAGMWIIQGVGTVKGGRNVDVMIRITPAMGGTLAVVAHINLLPDPTTPDFSTENLLALCRDLLEFNGMDQSGDACFAIRELPTGQGPALSAITVEIRRPIRGLDYEEFQRSVSHVASLADENDERLEREFRAPKIRMQIA